MSENLDKNLNETEPVTDSTVGDAADTASEEESTIFSAPAEHKDKAPKAGSANTKRLMSIISACIAVAVLVVGTVFVIKNFDLLTNDETTQNNSALPSITLLEAETDTFKNVKITNENGEFNFKKEKITATDSDGNTNTSEYWIVNDMDHTKLSDMVLSEKVSAASSFVAMQEIDKLSASECGLDKPTLKIEISTGTEYYHIFVGKRAPDGSGSYVKVEGNVNKDLIGKIYLVKNSYFDAFKFDLKALANISPIPITTFETDTSENKSEDGAYAYFDSLTISGKRLGETVTIVNNKEENETAAIVTYLTTTPTERYAFAQNLAPFINLFSTTTPVTGCYAFDITEETLKEVGLDDPDFVITLTINGESKVFKLNEVAEPGSEDRFFAVVYDGATMIRKVNISNLTNIDGSSGISIADYTIEDFYMPNMFIYSIFDISSLKFENSTDSFAFDIVYDQESEAFNVTSNGKKINGEKFQDFYERLINVECSDFALSELATAAEGKITFTFKDKTQSIIEFYNISATEYQYSINGKQMGKIPASYYSTNIVEAFANIAKEVIQ